MLFILNRIYALFPIAVKWDSCTSVGCLTKRTMTSAAVSTQNFGTTKTRQLWEETKRKMWCNSYSEFKKLPQIRYFIGVWAGKIWIGMKGSFYGSVSMHADFCCQSIVTLWLHNHFDADIICFLTYYFNCYIYLISLFLLDRTVSEINRDKQRDGDKSKCTLYKSRCI